MKQFCLYIGNKRYSSWSFRAWLLLKIAGIPFCEEKIWIGKSDSGRKIDKVSPGGKVPTLKDGANVIWESLAICEYLAEKFPQKNLWPKDVAARAEARSIANEMHAGFQGLRANMPCNFVRRYPVFSIPESAKPDINRIIDIWKSCRRRYGKSGPFLFGKFSIADAMYAPVVFRFLAYSVKVDRVSAEYMKTIEFLPATQEWLCEAVLEKERIEKYEL